MSLNTFLEITKDTKVRIWNEFEDGYGVGYLDDIGPGLYLVNYNNLTARRLPDEYQKTQMYWCSPTVGGLDDSGMIMVNVMGEVPLSGYHDCSGASGMWGWIDKDFNVVIEPQFIFAYPFGEDGRAIVCRGTWTEKNGGYWSYDEQWGVIDTVGREVVPCVWDDQIHFGDADENYIVVKDGHYDNNRVWHHGIWNVIEIETGNVVFASDQEKTGDYLRYSGVEHGYLTITTEDCEKEYLYDLENKKYLFKDKSYETVIPLGRDKFKIDGCVMTFPT